MPKRMKIIVQERVASELSRSAAEFAVRFAGLQAENELTKIYSLPPRRTGKIYKRGSVVHRASAPGESPAPDTGELRQSVVSFLEVEGNDIAAIVGTPLKRAKHLELGTDKIAPRPAVARLSEPPRVKRIHRAAIAGVRQVYAGTLK